jgi:hypothetical protein
MQRRSMGGVSCYSPNTTNLESVGNGPGRPLDGFPVSPCELPTERRASRELI